VLKQTLERRGGGWRCDHEPAIVEDEVADHAVEELDDLFDGCRLDLLDAVEDEDPGGRPVTCSASQTSSAREM